MCTAISLNSDAHYFGRTLDLEYGYHETVTITPRNYPFQFTNGAIADSHYAMIGMATVIDGYPLYYEATNEWGLSVAGLNFPGLAHYTAPANGKTNVAVFEFIPWLLCHCRSVNDFCSMVSRLNIVDTAFRSDLPPTPLHWMIADKDRCLVIEPEADGIRCYENPVGVMTNGPAFSYHLTHLQDYQQLSPLPPVNRFSVGDTTPYSGAMGGMGLPGDWSSASRFIRAAFVKTNSPTLPTKHENVNQFFRILQSVSMPMGSIQIKPGVHNITRYACCCDTAAGKYYYTTYANSRITCVDIRGCDLDGRRIRTLQLKNQPDIFTETER